jgi:hypothetical protein
MQTPSRSSGSSHGYSATLRFDDSTFPDETMDPKDMPDSKDYDTFEGISRDGRWEKRRC